MTTKQVIGISVLSSLLTLTAVIAVLFSSGKIIAQGPEPTPIATVDPHFPDSFVTTSSEFTAPTETEDPEGLAAATQYLHIAGSTFNPLYFDTNPYYAYAGCTYATGVAGHEYYNFPLVLPYGSTITALRYYYNDTSANNSSLRIREMDDGNGFTDVAVVSSTGNTGLGFQTVTGLSYLMDYTNFSYVLQWAANGSGSTSQLCGARITYTPPAIFGVALPTVIKKTQP